MRLYRTSKSPKEIKIMQTSNGHITGVAKCLQDHIGIYEIKFLKKITQSEKSYEILRIETWKELSGGEIKNFEITVPDGTTHYLVSTSSKNVKVTIK